jgi:hypothetical protein
MNYSRFQPRQQIPSQGRNFGSDIHEFMEGLSKIAQILYTSIPIIEFLRISSKYSLKFFEFIGNHLLKTSGLIKSRHRPEVLLEALWNTEPKWRLLGKYSAALAIGVVLFCLLFSKPEPELEEEWKSIEVQQKPEILSVEDKPLEESEYIDEYSGYNMY